MNNYSYGDYNYESDSNNYSYGEYDAVVDPTDADAADSSYYNGSDSNSYSYNNLMKAKTSL